MGALEGAAADGTLAEWGTKLKAATEVEAFNKNLTKQGKVT